jgi:hypothetical protein
MLWLPPSLPAALLLTLCCPPSELIPSSESEKSSTANDVTLLALALLLPLMPLPLAPRAPLPLLPLPAASSPSLSDRRSGLFSSSMVLWPLSDAIWINTSPTVSLPAPALYYSSSSSSSSSSSGGGGKQQTSKEFRQQQCGLRSLPTSLSPR